MGTGTLGPDGEQDYPLSTASGAPSSIIRSRMTARKLCAPNSVAGTFGVTNADMDASYVGAFGAYKK